MRVRTWNGSGLVIGFLLSTAGSALAQTPPPAPADPATPAPGTGAVAPAPQAPEASPPAQPEPTPEATPSPPPTQTQGTDAEVGREVPLAPPELHPVPPDDEPPSEHQAAWYDRLRLSAFADAYLSVNYAFPKPQHDANAAVRAYDTSNGFSVAWVGLDASYPTAPLGGTVSLRFGPAAERLAKTCIAAPCDSELGLTNVKQAFASWRPGGEDGTFQLDLGKFDTIYGAEVADSQGNINYTRGLLYWFAQPAFHTGLRFEGDFSEAFILKAMLVNGYNNSVDNNVGKTLGVQGIFNLEGADDALASIALGYLVGPERDDTKDVECGPGEAFEPSTPTGCVAQAGSPGASGTVDRASSNTKGLRHLIDLVATITPMDGLTVILNGDFGVERVRDEADETVFVTKKWYGAMAGARYGLSEEFAIAGRGEYLADPDAHITGFPGNSMDLASGTLTVDFTPNEFLLIRLDNRLDWSSREIFKKNIRDASGTMFTTTLGVVATTN